MRRVALWATITLASITWLVVTWRLREILFVLLLSLAIAATMGEPVARLERLGVSRLGSLLATYVGIFGGLILGGAALAWAMVGELDPLLHDIVRGYGAVLERVPTTAGPRSAWVASLPPAEQVSHWLTGEQPTELLSALFSYTIDAGHALAVFTVAVVLSIYWAPDRHRLERLWLSLVPPDQRGRVRRLGRDVEAEVGAYIRSEVIQTILAIGVLAIGYGLLGLKYPTTVALVAGVLWLIPLLGAALAMVPIVALGLLVSPALAGIGALFTFAVLAVLEFFVQPRFHRRSHYWGVLLVMMMLVLGDALGLAGLVLAPPVALALQKVVDEVLTPSGTGVTEGAPDLATLSARVAAIREQVQARQDETSPRLHSLLDRLDALAIEIANTAVIPTYVDEATEA